MTEWEQIDLPALQELDGRAWEVAMRVIFPFVEAVIFVKEPSLSEIDKEELRDQVVVELFKNISRVTSIKRLKGLIRLLIAHRGIDLARRKIREPELHRIENEDFLADDSAYPAAPDAYVELQDLVEHFLGTLSPQERSLLLATAQTSCRRLRNHSVYHKKPSNIRKKN